MKSNSPMRNIYSRSLFLLFGLLAGTRLWGMSDNLSLTVTNTWTHLPVVFNLQRYNLRGTNYQVRVYSDVTNYTLLPTNQIPGGDDLSRPHHRATRARWWLGRSGRTAHFITTSATVAAGSRARANMILTTRPTGCRGAAGVRSVGRRPIFRASAYDNYAYQTNMPLHITWTTNNYPTNPAVSYGGPPYMNNLKQVPLQRARLVLDSDYLRCLLQPGRQQHQHGDLLQESRINDVDYEQARDLGVCYQIACVCVRTNTQLPYTTTDGRRCRKKFRLLGIPIRATATAWPPTAGLTWCMGRWTLRSATPAGLCPGRFQR